MRQISYIQLGGTLFTPASNNHLISILRGEKFPTLKSLVIDFEDGLNSEEYYTALERFSTVLKNYTPNKLLVFIRPRDPLSLKEFLNIPYITNIDGFVLPKFSLNNHKEYLHPLDDQPFYIMPSIEKEELFDISSLQRLRDILLQRKDQVLSIRIGCEDMFKQLRLFRLQNESIFQRSLTASIVTDILKTFKPYGFNISGCVYKYFNDNEGLLKDATKELHEGLFSKTIIHPNQIEPLNQLYKVTQEQYHHAQQVFSSTNAVFNIEGVMGEKTTQLPYAQEILKRAKIYGII